MDNFPASHMKPSFANLICLLSVTLLTSAMAGDLPVRNAGEMEAKARKLSLELHREATELEKKAFASGAKLTKETEDYIEILRQEAQWAEKSSTAWGNNQKRLAEKYEEKVREFCEKRGPLAKKVYACEEKESEKKKSEKCEEKEKAITLEEIERQQAALEEKKQKVLKNNKPE